MNVIDLLPPGFPPDMRFSTTQAAVWLNEHRNTVLCKCKTGEYRATKCGRVWKIDRVEMFRIMGLDVKGLAA